jgi:hypothetical protein
MSRRGALLFGPFLIAACLWRGYADILRVHLDVLAGLADKAAANIAGGRRPSSNDVTELTYPLQRARQFLEQSRAESNRESYALFAAALDRYNALVTAIDAARGDEARWTAARPALEAEHAGFVTAVERVRAALEREG